MMPARVTAWLWRYGDIAAGTLVAIGLCVLLAHLRRGAPPPIPPKDQTTLDSLAVTRPTYTAAIDTLTVHETTYVARSVRAAQTANVQRTNADSLAHVADSLGVDAAAQHDSNTTWHVIAELRKREADALHTANDSLRAALTFEQLARAAADGRALRAEQRDSASEALNQRLAAAVAHAGDCHLVPFVPCPSRKVSAIGGVIAGAAAMYKLALR